MANKDIGDYLHGKRGRCQSRVRTEKSILTHFPLDFKGVGRGR